MDIQWFPGHMLKTQRLIQENLGKVDVFLEVVDSRAPLATSNPLLEKLIQGKPRVVLLNKIDLCDSHILALWRQWWDARPETLSVPISCKERKNLPALRQAAEKACRHKKWFGLRRVRAMIVGVPNVGKSTLINSLSGGHKASTAPKPGHTKGLQRINTEAFDLVDTPGILWHKFEDPEVGIRLALLGSIKDEILSSLDLAAQLYRFLARDYPKAAERHFGAVVEGADPWVYLEAWGRRHGMLKHGGEVDEERLAQNLLAQFRTGKLGRFSLEKPPIDFPAVTVSVAPQG